MHVPIATRSHPPWQRASRPGTLCFGTHPARPRRRALDKGCLPARGGSPRVHTPPNKRRIDWLPLIWPRALRPAPHGRHKRHISHWRISSRPLRLPERLLPHAEHIQSSRANTKGAQTNTQLLIVPCIYKPEKAHSNSARAKREVNTCHKETHRMSSQVIGAKGVPMP